MEACRAPARGQDGGRPKHHDYEKRPPGGGSAIEEDIMLCITMRRGEYFTVGSDTVVLFDQLSGERAHLTIHAPREVPIVRGEVLERQGRQRPACLSALPPRKKYRYRPTAAFLWNDERERAIRALEKLADRLEEKGAAAEAELLRAQIDQIVPTTWEDELTNRTISSGSRPAGI